MKVLVVNWRDIYHPEAGGAEIHIHELLKRKPPDWEVDFVSATFPGCEKTRQTPWYTIIRLPNNFFFHMSFFFWWWMVGRKRGYDLVIDDISKIPLATPCYIRRIPLIALMHHIHGRSLYTILPWPLATYVYLMERYGLGAYVRTPLIAVSPSTAEELRHAYPYQKLFVAYNGIDRYPLSPEEKRAKRDPTPLVVYLGRLKSYKRVDHFLLMAAKVAREFPEARFVVVGQGEEADTLRQLSFSLGISDRVLFVGFVDDREKEAWLDRAWLMVLPSEKEGWGIVVIEANASGTPVVGYKIPGLVDSIRDGVTGVLVEEQNPEALAERVCALLRDPERLEIMSSQALRWAGRFHWDEMAKEFYERVRSVMEEFHAREVL